MDKTPLQLKYDDGTDATRTTHFPLSFGARFQKGLHSGVWFWVAALCCLPIPLMHFILVPLFLILGTMRAWLYWTTPTLVDPTSVKCPRCKTEIAMDEMPESYPLKVLCPNCAFQIRLYN